MEHKRNMASSSKAIAAQDGALFRASLPTWIACVVAAVAAYFTFRHGVSTLLEDWASREEYSHAYLIPLIAVFLAWQRKNELAALPFPGSWAGVALVVLAIGIGVLGQLGNIQFLEQFGLVLAICGFVLALTGWRALRLLWMPLVLLFFVVPLPGFVQSNVSAGMQLWSSALGVWFIRLMGISVYLSGNVIDLGTYKLQVVEACDGLRYLFPLMTLGLVMAFFYQGAVWKRLLIFLSSIPITILMNSLRIGMIGWMVEHWGPGMAEGFVHDFQGWAVFMASLALMVLLMIGLSFVGQDRRPWRELFGVELPDPLPKGVPLARRALVPSAVAACVALAAGIAATAWAQSRDMPVPERQSFADFPMVLGQWFGERRGMSQGDLQVLQLSDYLLARYRGPAPREVDLYIAWYGSQDKGRYMHSPRTCLPGGGWKILEHSEVQVPGVQAAGQPLRVNRVLMESRASQALVYYWFQQRGRVTTDGWLTKWHLLWDSVTTGRSDGALVRLIVPLGEGEQSSNADADLARFAEELEPVLDQFVPR
jgi:exosortase D (VPLPA-CTERM-specific)